MTYFKLLRTHIQLLFTIIYINCVERQRLLFSNGYTSKRAESELLRVNINKYEDSALFYWQRRPFLA
ncbi:hypothetical protein CJF42_10605 [Pseudoalteromonas sp. NBT06-2]|nr:hypothetical protein CJF42_10605 [Pseudoalteromonas sp. NBT06-2]